MHFTMCILNGILKQCEIHVMQGNPGCGKCTISSNTGLTIIGRIMILAKLMNKYAINESVILCLETIWMV